MEYILRALFAGVVYQHQRNAVGVCKGFQLCQRVIVGSVAAAVGCPPTDTLEGIDDDQNGIGLVHQEAFQLRQQVLIQGVG